LFDPGTIEYADVSVYVRRALHPGHGLVGPALIRDKGTTIMVPESYAAIIADDNSVVIEKQGTP
jgi:N-methylhydantoinase A/oxoprolinase/acetone carboxylase beta subunit